MTFKRYAKEGRHFVNDAGCVMHYDATLDKPPTAQILDSKNYICLDTDLKLVWDRTGNHNCPNYNRQCDVTYALVRR